MSQIGQKESQTQQRVKAFLQEFLRYRYLDHWKDREDNSNVEQGILHEWLQKQGYADRKLPRIPARHHII